MLSERDLRGRSEVAMADTVAFMVMPFANKPTGKSGKQVPDVVDFDKLWYRVHKPVLEELGYQAVRADADMGGFVIAELIQRLAVADLVLADVPLANANVYYEVGVRQAAKERGCVLVAATWADPVFDSSRCGGCGRAAADRARRFDIADPNPGRDEFLLVGRHRRVLIETGVGIPGDAISVEGLEDRGVLIAPGPHLKPRAVGVARGDLFATVGGSACHRSSSIMCGKGIAALVDVLTCRRMSAEF
jgi:hypothetical protein